MKNKFYTCKYDRVFKEIMLNEEKINIAKNMLKDNVAIDVIMKYTNLSVNEINSLK